MTSRGPTSRSTYTEEERCEAKVYLFSEYARSRNLRCKNKHLPNDTLCGLHRYHEDKKEDNASTLAANKLYRQENINVSTAIMKVLNINPDMWCIPDEPIEFKPGYVYINIPTLTYLLRDTYNNGRDAEKRKHEKTQQ